MHDFGESIVIDAPGDQLYALVSDLPRMGEWSLKAAAESARQTD
jgi:uncharacterized membrane protein